MMMTSDPIADMLTRIRNANTAKHDTVDIPASKIKVAIAGILLDEGYITKYDIIEDGNFKTIRITLKYGADKNEKIITGLKRISKPGLRVYAGKDELPRVLGGLGIAILLQIRELSQTKKQETPGWWRSISFRLVGNNDFLLMPGGWTTILIDM